MEYIYLLRPDIVQNNNKKINGNFVLDYRIKIKDNYIWKFPYSILKQIIFYVYSYPKKVIITDFAYHIHILHIIFIIIFDESCYTKYGCTFILFYFLSFYLLLCFSYGKEYKINMRK